MIVLDTNVISEMTKPQRSQWVVDWLNAQPLNTLYLTSITVAEKGYGLAAMPPGRRRQDLLAAFGQTRELFAGRILPFDEAAAITYAALAAGAKAKGRALPTADGYIAAIAATHGFAVATRDTSPFVAAGLGVINPWEAD